MKDRETYLKNYAKARSNLLMMTVLTAANIFLLLANVSFNFPFSALAPQILASIGLYVEDGVRESWMVVTGVVLGIAALGVYLLCYFLSKKNRGWMSAAAVLFGLDCVLLLFIAATDFDASMLIEIAFHVWVMVYLVLGVIANANLKKLPEDETAAAPLYAGEAPAVNYGQDAPPAPRNAGTDEQQNENRDG